jgi:hypothetical protein
LIKAISPAGGERPVYLTAAMGRVFFTYNDSLWTSDGSAAGTLPVEPSDAPVQHAFSPVNPLVEYDRALYGSAIDDISGYEPWRVNDEWAPSVPSQSFDVRAGRSLTIKFNEDVVVDSAAVRVTNVATSTDVSDADVHWSYDPATRRLTVAIGDASSSPADGNYRLSLLTGHVADLAGNGIAADLSVDFFVLAADANHDRKVDFTDLVKLAQNYNTSGKTFAEGDFNLDGTVDFDDLVLLAQRYNTTLAAPAPAAPARAKESLLKATAPQPTKPIAPAKKPNRPAFGVTRVR